MKYLVVEYDYDEEEFGTPICVTNDYSDYKSLNYVIFEIKKDGSLERVNVELETGFCLINMHESDNRKNWEVLDKAPNVSREEFIKSKIFDKWIARFNMESFKKEIAQFVNNTGGSCFFLYKTELKDIGITNYIGNTLYYPY